MWIRERAESLAVRATLSDVRKRAVASVERGERLYPAIFGPGMPVSGRSSNREHVEALVDNPRSDFRSPDLGIPS